MVISVGVGLGLNDRGNPLHTSQGGGLPGIDLPYYPSLLALSGFNFAIIPDTDRQPYNSRQANPAGKAGTWYRLEAHTGDNNGTETTVERVGIDGYPNSLQRDFSTDFSVILDENALSRGASDWLSLFEMHAKNNPAYPSEYETAGPFSMMLEWSAGSGTCVFRIYRKSSTANPLTGAGDITPVIVYQSAALTPGVQYDFRVQTRQSANGNADGFVKVFMGTEDGTKTQIVNELNVAFGYGVERVLYPQWRIYRNTRAYPEVSYYRIDAISTAAVAASNTFNLRNGSPITLRDNSQLLGRAA